MSNHTKRIDTPSNTEHWQIIKKAVHGRSYWIVSCKKCGKSDERTVRQIETNQYPCSGCSSHRKNAIMLTALGQTLPLTAWAELYPDRIKPQNVRQYLTMRRKGRPPYHQYTDEQLLFGANLDRHPDPTLSSIDKELLLQAKSVKKSAYLNSIEVIFQDVSKALLDAMTKELAKYALSPGTIAMRSRVAGHDYLIDSLGITVGELLEVDTPVAEVASYLKQEKFSNVSEKSSKLLDFVPTVEPHRLHLTDIEIMALLSRYSMD